MVLLQNPTIKVSFSHSQRSTSVIGTTKPAPLCKQWVTVIVKVPFFHFLPRILNFPAVRRPEKGAIVIEGIFENWVWILGKISGVLEDTVPWEAGPKSVALSKIGLSYSFPTLVGDCLGVHDGPHFTLSWGACM